MMSSINAMNSFNIKLLSNTCDGRLNKRSPAALLVGRNPTANQPSAALAGRQHLSVGARLAANCNRHTMAQDPVAADRIQLAAAPPHQDDPPLLAYDPKTHKFNREAMKQLSMAAHKTLSQQLQQREHVRSILRNTSLDGILPEVGLEAARKLDEQSKVEEVGSAYHGRGGRNVAEKPRSATAQLHEQWKNMQSPAFVTRMLTNHCTTLFARHGLTDDEVAAVSHEFRNHFFPVATIVDEILQFAADKLAPPPSFKGTKQEYCARAIRVLLQPFLDMQEELVCSVMERKGRSVTIRPQKLTEEQRRVQALLQARGGPHSPQHQAQVGRNLTRVRTTLDDSRRPRRTPLSRLVAQHRETAAASKAEARVPAERQQELDLQEFIRTTHVMNQRRTAEQIAHDREPRGRDGDFNVFYRKAIFLELMTYLTKDAEAGTLAQRVDAFFTVSLNDVSTCTDPVTKVTFEDGHHVTGRKGQCKRCGCIRMLATSELMQKLQDRVEILHRRSAPAAGGSQAPRRPRDPPYKNEQQFLQETQVLDSALFYITPQVVRVLFLLWLTREYDMGVEGATDEQLLQVFFDGPDAFLKSSVWNRVVHTLEDHDRMKVCKRPKHNGHILQRHVVTGVHPAVLGDLCAVLKFHETAVQADVTTGAGAAAGPASAEVRSHRHAQSPRSLAPVAAPRVSRRRGRRCETGEPSRKGGALSPSPSAPTDYTALLKMCEGACSDDDGGDGGHAVEKGCDERQARSAPDGDASPLRQHSVASTQAESLHSCVESLVSHIVDEATHGRRDVSASPPAIIHRSTSVAQDPSRARKRKASANNQKK